MSRVWEESIVRKFVVLFIVLSVALFVLEA